MLAGVFMWYIGVPKGDMLLWLPTWRAYFPAAWWYLLTVLYINPPINLNTGLRKKHEIDIE